MEKYILSIDQGTTSSRSIIFDTKANTVISSQKEFTQIFPQSGWVEHDPMEILATQISTIQDCLQHNQNISSNILTIGITNQRETVIAWNKNSGTPYYNAIVWQDTRTSNFCKGLKSDSLDQLIKEKTGLVLDSYFSASKMNWILQNCPDAKKDALKDELLFGTVDTWLIWNFTNGKSHVTDASNAARTLLFNINTGDWDDELLDIFQIPKSTLPAVKSSSDDFGVFELDEYRIPINGVAGDQQSALFGQCCFQKGMAKNTYGTGCFMLMNTGDKKIESKNGLLTTIAWKIDGKITYALEGSVFVAGSAIQWLRDGLQVIENAEASEKLALKANTENEVYVVPAFAGLGAPYWDMYARGGILGLTRDSGIPEITKATLDSLAYQTKDVLDAMALDSNIELQSLQVDGGACANNYLMQFQSDILQKKIDRPINKESTALGVAFLAGLKIGLWKLEDLMDIRSTEKIFEPIMTAEVARKKYSKWQDAVRRIRDWSA